MKNLFILLSIFNCFIVFADAIPFKSNEIIELNYSKSVINKFERIGIVYENYQTKQLDTFFDCEGSQCLIIDNENTIRLIRFVPDKFKVIIYFKDKLLVSPFLKENGNYSYHKLSISENEIEDITPIFGTSYKNYFTALIITLILELFIALIFFKLNTISYNNLIFIVVINLLTHPILWLISANIFGFYFGNTFGELFVFLAEAVLLYYFIKPIISKKNALKLSFQMNILSYIIGGLIYLILVSK